MVPCILSYCSSNISHRSSLLKPCHIRDLRCTYSWLGSSCEVQGKPGNLLKSLSRTFTGRGCQGLLSQTLSYWMGAKRKRACRLINHASQIFTEEFKRKKNKLCALRFLQFSNMNDDECWWKLNKLDVGCIFQGSWWLMMNQDTCNQQTHLQVANDQAEHIMAISCLSNLNLTAEVYLSSVEIWYPILRYGNTAFSSGSCHMCDLDEVGTFWCTTYCKAYSFIHSYKLQSQHHEMFFPYSLLHSTSGA